MNGFLFKIHILSGLLVFSVLSGINAQKSSIGVPLVTNYVRSDYQAGTQNWAIGQDARGIMYFGNNKGLLEYDGTNWQIYPLPNRTIVRSFAFAPEGVLYVGGQNEFGFFSTGTAGNLIYESLSDKIPSDMIGFEDVWSIFLQGDHVFFCSEKAVFDWADGTFKVILPPGGRFENFFRTAGKIYLQDKTDGLFALLDSRLSPVKGGENIGDERIVAMLPFKESQHLVITASQGLFLLDEDGMKVWTTEASAFAIDNQAYCATKLNDGRFAVGTAQNGVLIADSSGMRLLHLNRDNGLQNNTVLSVFQDAQSHLWMGLDNGIGYAEIKSPFSIIGPESGIKGTGYASLIYDGVLYLGTNQGLYRAKWHEIPGERKKPIFEPVEKALGQVWNLNETESGVVVSQHKGAAYLRDGRVEPFSSIQGSWKFMELRGRPGFAIEGTYTGLVVYRKESGLPNKWKLVKELKGFDESARVFEEDLDGNIWVSHAYKGLFKIELSENADEIVTLTSYTSEHGLPAELFINVAKIRNELVFTTPEGIFRYNKFTDRFEEHTEFNEIFGANRNVHRLLEDQSGNIWFSIDSEFGLLKVDDSGVFSKFELSYFNQLQEALVDGFEHVYAYDEANVIIGTEKGFVHFNPLKETQVGFPFQVLIRRVTSITDIDSTVYWGHAANEGEEGYSFHHKMNDFRFDFSAPYFEENSHLLYRYKLDGFDKDWSDWTVKTEKEYTNLAHGSYIFSVQARNAYGELSEEAGFSFKVRPPWYSTIYARLAYFILGLVALFMVVTFISKREARKTDQVRREQAAKLEMKEAEFKKEVEKSESELVAMRNEKLQDDIKHKTSQLASATMHLVQKSEMLMKLKSDLSQISDDAPGPLRQKIRQVTRTIESDIQLDNNWDQFETYFDQVHENFFKRLRQKFPDLTPKDQKLCAYLRMNLSTKEIAPLLNISVRGVEISRYRVRKKLGLDSDTNLVTFIMDV
jgi:ligand-binding sensor domain-containing protein/DNA-binding CsgD family transcriptional regulator